MYGPLGIKLNPLLTTSYQVRAAKETEKRIIELQGFSGRDPSPSKLRLCHGVIQHKVDNGLTVIVTIHIVSKSYWSIAIMLMYLVWLLYSLNIVHPDELLMTTWGGLLEWSGILKVYYSVIAKGCRNRCTTCI